MPCACILAHSRLNTAAGKPGATVWHPYRSFFLSVFKNRKTALFIRFLKTENRKLVKKTLQIPDFVLIYTMYIYILLSGGHLNMKKKVLSIILALVMVAGMLPFGAITAFAEEGVMYLEYNAETGAFEELTCTDYTPLAGGVTAWTGGWYVAPAGKLELGDVNVNGSSYLILTDGCELIVNGGIHINNGSSLTIYAQSEGENAGNLVANGRDYCAGIGGYDESCGNITINGGNITANGGEDGAGIGSRWCASCGSITINGGNITANGGERTAGIGSGSRGSCGNITINGGAIVAKGGTPDDNDSAGAGIGNGYNGSCGDITINGGDIIAIGADSLADYQYYGGVAIGNSYKGTCGKVIINGCNIVAAGGRASTEGSVCGKPFNAEVVLGNHVCVFERYNEEMLVSDNIGTKNYCDLFNSLAVDGLSGRQASAISVLENGLPDNVIKYSERYEELGIALTKYEFIDSATPITSETRSLTSGWYKADGAVTVSVTLAVTGNVHIILNDGCTLRVNGGIKVESGNSLSIYSKYEGTGQLVTRGYDYQPGIGGFDGDAGDITIYGGNITATGGNFSAGIGGARYRNAGNVTIAGGTVTANGGGGGAGIGGGGDYGNGGTVTIYGGSVTANGGYQGAGIGGGSHGNGGTVNIYGGSVTANGGARGAGIGAGTGSATKNGGNVYIYGGNINAVGGYHAAGIGGGEDTNGAEIYVSGGSIIATGGEGCAAFGCGYKTDTIVALSIGEIYPCDNAAFYNGRDDSIIKGDIIYLTDSYTYIGPVNNTAVKDEQGRNTVYFYAMSYASKHTDYLAYNTGSKKYEKKSIDEGKAFGIHGSTTWDLPWYEVDGNQTIDSTVTVNGDVSLILKEGCKLEANGGITVTEGSSLTVYGQSVGTGELIAKSPSNNSPAIKVGEGARLTVHSGKVTAYNSKYAAGIGGSYQENGGNITVYGGCVTASSEYGAGIGGGYISSSQGELSFADGLSIKAGSTADNSTLVTAEQYKTNRNGYVFVHSHDFTGKYCANDAYTHSRQCTFCDVCCEEEGNHTFIEGVCSACKYKCKHSFADRVCTLCGKSQEKYIARSWDSDSKKVVSSEIYIPETAQEITADTTTLSSGWYTVDDEVTVDGRITVSGNANLILKDGCTLEVKGGIKVSVDNSLTIYAQSDGENTGRLIADSSSGTNVISGSAGIGGDKYNRVGNITVHGGRIIATGNDGGAGIGGGDNRNNEYVDKNITVTVYGGDITATGSDGAAGIGGGYNENGGTVTINGGNITATGGDHGAGIGSGYHTLGEEGYGTYGDGGTVTVNGGNVTAVGKIDAAGIGGGRNCDGNTFTMTGGVVSATGEKGAGIGGGFNGYGTDFIFSGGCVTAVSAYGAGIGVGYNGGSGFSGNHEFIVADGTVIKAGDTAADSFVTAQVYAQYRYKNVSVHIHDYTGEYKNNGNGTHSRQCAYCDVVGTTSEEHTFVNHICVCGATSEHSFTGDYVDNGDGTHSRKCTGCDELSASEAHTFVDHECVCGATSEHSFTGDYVNNGDGTHSRKCMGCDELSAPEAHAFVDHECVCGATNEHDFTGEYVNNGDGTHSRKCTGCDEVGEAEVHTYADGVCVCGAHNWGKYIDRRWDEDSKQVISTELDIPSDAKEITADTIEIGGGWYVLRENVEIENRIVVKGTGESPTNIMLFDGFKLEAKDGIEVNEGYVLNIYGQANETGAIVATGIYQAGIGGDDLVNGGTVTVNGGTVTATSDLGAGIGGGSNGNGGAVTVNGGIVTAKSLQGTGIGGGWSSDVGGAGSTVTINGGTVTATSAEGVGIGAGYLCDDHGTLTVADGLFIKAGDNAEAADFVNAEEYKANRNPYVTIYKAAPHDHDFTGKYVDNHNGTHSRKCTGCGEISTPEAHTYVDHVCVCGAHNWGKYIDRRWDEDSKQVISTELDIPSNAKEITADTKELGGGWYIVLENIEISDRITVKGTAQNPTNIILPDGVTLNATAGIEVDEGYVLNIYGQKNDTGEIIAQTYIIGAGIGGGDRYNNCGSVTVNGGTVTATSDAGAGIGGGNAGIGGTVTVNGGTVTATSELGAGIGGGESGDIGGTVTVNGGTVTATSELGAGIGGGYQGDGGTVTVNGGTVTATSQSGAGIGGGKNAANNIEGDNGGNGGNGGIVTVNGGTVTATSESGAGIGGGYQGDGGSFTISDGTVRASSQSGMAIGAGSSNGNNGEFVYKGGTVLLGTLPSAHEHTFSDKWSHNELVHWHESTCEHDDLTKNMAAHTFDESGKCTVCGYEDTGIRAKVCTVILTSIDEPDTVLYSGTTDGTNLCNIANVANGTYLMSVSCEGAVTRTYTTEITDGRVTQEVALYAEGDVNGDGEINANDYALAVNAALGAQTEVAKDLTEAADYQKAVADLDGDGFVDVLDAVLLERKIF